MEKAGLVKKLKEYENYRISNGCDERLVDAICLAVDAAVEVGEQGIILQACGSALSIIREYIKNTTKNTFEVLETYSQEMKQGYKVIDQYYGVLHYAARYSLDAFCLYVERNRKRSERFYEPRRKRLKEFVMAIEDLEYDRLDELYLHCPPRIGKTQLTTLATAWHCARNDEKANLYVTYKNSLGGAFLDGVMEIIRDPTYAFYDVFPNERIIHTDSEAHKMNMGRRKKYATLSGKGMDSGLNGEFDASGWLILDDLHEGIQEVLNPERLARAQTIFDNNVLTRRKAGCKILGIGTIWANSDIFSDREEFLATNPKAKKVRWRVIKIPALNENDESNFDYAYGVGYSTEEYHMTRAKFEQNGDLASWEAQFQQNPIDREGTLFKIEDMRFYNGILPAEEPLKVVCACDVALGGDDYLSLPIAYCYEDGSVYIDDVVYDNSEKKFTKPQVVDKIIVHHVTSGYFEANQGGEGYKDEVNEELVKKGLKINLQSKYAPTDKRKEQRIWDKAGSIREYYFRDSSCRSSQYQKFMHNLFNFNFKQRGKKVHQDAADSLASLAYFLEGTWGNAKVEAVMNPFRRKQYLV